MKLRPLVFALLLLPTWVRAASQAMGEDWPQFRGPDGQGHARQANLPLTWDIQRNVGWQQTVAGQGWSSPIVYHGRIYLTTAVAADPTAATRQSLRAVCLEAETGSVVWEREVFLAEPGPIHQKNSYASPTPLTDGQRIYVHFGPEGTAALDFEGRIIWTNRTINYDANHGGGGSPILSGELLIFNCDGVTDPFVIALDKTTGQERWRSFRPEMEPQRFSFSTPLEIEHAGRSQIVSPGSSYVCSYAPEDGKELWRVGFSTRWSVIPRPVYWGGLVFVTTGYEGPASLLAIRPDGSGDVTQTHVVWRSERSVPHTPSPLIVEGKLFLLSDGGIASCLDALTGTLHWRKRLGGTYSASPLHAGGKVYCQSEAGECVVFAAATTYEELARNDLQEPSLASFAAADGALFIRTATQLYRIENTP